jgi:hypothetical protein
MRAIAKQSQKEIATASLTKSLAMREKMLSFKKPPNDNPPLSLRGAKRLRHFCHCEPERRRRSGVAISFYIIYSGFLIF